MTLQEWLQHAVRCLGGNQAPTPEDLAAWLPECPEALQAEAGERLRQGLWQAANTPDLPGDLAHTALLATLADRWGWGAAEAGLAAVGRGPTATVTTPADRVHQVWLAIPKDRPKHPLGPVVRAWQERPPRVHPETRKDKRILPVVQVLDPHRDRVQGVLFGGLTEGRAARQEQELPLFQEFPERKRVPLLEIADSAGVPVMAQGRGAPLERRFFIRTLATVRPQDRHREHVRMAITLRELVNGLFPKGWERRRDLPRLAHALKTAREYTIPSIWEGSVGYWWPIALRHMPANPGLADKIILDIAFPPNSRTGPTVELPEMDNLSVESGPRHGAYIAAHSLAWQPGTTRVPHPQNPRHHVWTGDADKYPVLTREDRRQLAYGERDAKHRTQGEVDAKWENLPGLVVVERDAVDPRTGEGGWRVVPVEAAEAIARKAAHEKKKR